jgi:hypothetical protein
MTEEQLKATNLFSDRLSVQVFDGTHEVNTRFLKELTGE